MSDELLHLELITPQRCVFSGEVAQVVAPGAQGLFGVLKGHVNYVTEVRPGPMRFQHGGQAHRYVVGAGFAQVGAARVVVLTEFCTPIEEVDVEAARATLRDAEKVLLEHEPASREYLDAQAAAAVAQATLWAASGGEPPVEG